MGVGGAEQVTLQVIEALAEKTTVGVISFYGSPSDAWFDKFRTAATSLSYPDPAGSVKGVRSVLASHLNDGVKSILISDVAPLFSEVDWLRKTFLQLKIVDVHHIGIPARRPPPPPRCLHVRNTLDTHVVVASQQRRWLADDFGVQVHRIELIANGVKIPVYRQRSNDPLAIGFVGRLDTVKRPMVVVDAAAALNAAGIDLRWFIAGAGPMERLIRSEVKAKNLSDVIGVPGIVCSEQMMEQIDILVLPSRVENLPMVVLEAMSAGVVPVCTRVGGVGDVIKPYVNGLLLDDDDDDRALALSFAEAVRCLVTNQTLRESLATAARRTIVEEFRVDKTVTAYAKLLL